MAFSSNQSGFKNGIVLRQVVLFVIFAVVLAGGIFEFGYSRPAYKAAWDHIQKIDSSATSSEVTAEDIEELFGKKPLEIDGSQNRVEVRVYRWPSGLPFRSHDIRVVYSKLTGPLAENNPDLADERYYYSASAGTELTSENFPAERPTIVMNMNKPSRAGGGGGGDPPPSSNPPPSLSVGDTEDAGEGVPPGEGLPDNADKKGDDKKGDDKKSDPESAKEENKTPPEPVENPGEPGKAEETKKKAEEAAPKGGEPEDAKPVEDPNPESGEPGEGNPDKSGGGEVAGG